MKLFILILCCFTAGSTFAQEPADALRYSWYVPGGSARIQAVGGANGSLGGDITAAFVNPAGLGFYKTGDIILSPVYSFGNTKATYLGRAEQQSTNKLTWGTTGFVIGSGGDRNTSAFSISVNRTADFNSDIQYRGQNNQSSYSQKFLEEIKNGNIKDANAVASNYPFGTSLAFNTYWIDTVGGGSSNNYQFKTRAPIATGLLQQNTIHSTGGISEIGISFAGNRQDKWLFGGTIGIPILNYRRDAEFTEADATDNPNNMFNYAVFHDNLHTHGAGINLKLGVIYKPAELWRLGFAAHSPTFYSLTDNYSADVTTDTEGYQGVQSQTSEYVAGAPSEFKYQLITPYKLIASASYVLHEVEDVRKQKGFLTADIEYTNYAASSFQPDDPENTDQSTKDYLKNLSKAVSNAYKGTFNFRAGGELKFTTVMVRAGVAYYGNPYKNINGENGNKLNLSGGLGYRNKGFFIDATYIYSINNDVNFAYRLQNSPYFGAAIKDLRSNILVTIGFKI